MKRIHWIVMGTVVLCLGVVSALLALAMAVMKGGSEPHLIESCLFGLGIILILEGKVCFEIVFPE